MSYAAVFCLTRADKLSGIKDNELFQLREFANNLGVNIPGTGFLNGSIYTFSQQSCYVVVLFGSDGMGLGHWKDFCQLTGLTMDRDVKRLLGGNYDQVYIISDTPENIAPIFARSGLRIRTHRKQAEKMYAAKAHRDDCGVYSIQASSQDNKFKEFLLGPCNATPVNQFKNLDFDGLN